MTEGLSLSAKFSYDFYYFNNVNRHITYGMKRYMGKDDEDNDIYMNVRQRREHGLRRDEHLEPGLLLRLRAELRPEPSGGIT